MTEKEITIAAVKQTFINLLPDVDIKDAKKPSRHVILTASQKNSWQKIATHICIQSMNHACINEVKQCQGNTTSPT